MPIANKCNKKKFIKFINKNQIQIMLLLGNHINNKIKIL